MMILVAALLGISVQTPQPESVFEIAEVDTTSVFAGRLGSRNSDVLTVRRNGQSAVIQVVGPYHTRAVRESERLHVGDKVVLSDQAIRTHRVLRADLRRASR